MKLQTLKISKIIFVLLVVFAITGLFLLSDAQAKRGQKMQKDRKMMHAEWLKKDLDLKGDQEATFMKVYNSVFDEKFKKKNEEMFKKMRNGKKDSEQMQKNREEMRKHMETYNSQFVDQIKKTKALSAEQIKQLEENTKKTGSGKGFQGKKGCGKKGKGSK